MKIVKSSCSSKKKVRTCTFSPQVNIKNKREPIQTQEDVNAAHSQAKIQDLIDDLENVIWTKVKEVATSETWGWDDDNVGEDFFVDVTPAEIGEDYHEAIRVEVRAEVDYEGLEELMEALNPIIESYDSYAYFEPVTSGIMEAYVSVDQVDMSVYGATASPDFNIYKYHGKSFAIHDNSSQIRDDVIEDVYYLWKGNVSQQAGAYNDADEDYVYAFIRGQGVVEYYRKGKYVATSNYNLRDEDDFEWAWEYMEIILQDVCDRLIAYNKDVPDRMVYNSTDIEASSDDSIMFEGNNYEYVTNNHGYWIYRAVIDGKGVWRAMKQGSDESQFSELSFPISYEQARGSDAIGEPSSIAKMRKDLGKMLLSNASTSSSNIDGSTSTVYASTYFKDVDGILGEPGMKYSFSDIKKIYEDGEDDPIISQYDSFEDWFNDTKNHLKLISYYSSVESSDYESDSGIFIEDIIDSLEDNGYDLSRIRSIRQGLLELFGYKGEDADTIIHDLVAGRFIDPNDWVDKDYTPGIYSATEEGYKASENYKGRRIRLLNDGTGYAIFEKGEMIDYGFKSLEDAEAAIDEYDDIYQDDVQVYSDTAEDEEDLPMVDQEYDSAATSINSNKLPAIYRMINLEPGKLYLDFGGGKFDNGIEYVKDKGATLVVYDPYNRSAEHNKEVLRILRENGGADAAINSNVLNVIKEPEARKNVLENIARITKPGAPIYITVYEGKGDGQEGPTKSGYQLNRKTADYLEEIQEVFPDATRRGKLITAHNSGVSAATNIGAKITCSDEYDTTWIKLAQKQVPDSDGFYTDYTMYISDDGTSYIFMFGDEDIYGPDPQYADYECSEWDEASEWWDDYNGFEDDDSLNDIQFSSSTDVTGSISAEEFFTKYDLIEFAISVEDEINRRINPKKKFNVSDAYVDGRNIHIELHNDEYELSGEASVDMRSIRRPSDIHKYLKPVIDEMINQYNEYRVDDITASTVFDMNPEFRNNFEEAVDFFYEDYPATVELTDEVDEDYDTLYKAYVKETGSLYQQTPGIVYIDINWDSGEILQALQETAEAIGIEQYPDNIESSEPVEGDAFSQLADAYLSPPEYDDPIEHEDSEELVEVELNQIITVDVDGDYEWDDDTYVWASPDESNEEWRSEDGVYIDDKVGVVEHIDDLIIPNVPTRPGKYRVTGLAHLVYDVSGILEYRTEYGQDDYDSDIDIDHAVVAFNFRKSEVQNLKITPVRR